MTDRFIYSLENRCWRQPRTWATARGGSGSRPPGRNRYPANGAHNTLLLLLLLHNTDFFRQERPKIAALSASQTHGGHII